jgi:hypothetical protein
MESFECLVLALKENTIQEAGGKTAEMKRSYEQRQQRLLEVPE